MRDRLVSTVSPLQLAGLERVPHHELHSAIFDAVRPRRVTRPSAVTRCRISSSLHARAAHHADIRQTGARPFEASAPLRSLPCEAECEGLEDCELMLMVRDKLMAGGATREAAQQQMEAIGRKAVRSTQHCTRSWRELEDTRRELLQQLR